LICNSFLSLSILLCINFTLIYITQFCLLQFHHLPLWPTDVITAFLGYPLRSNCSNIHTSSLGVMCLLMFSWCVVFRDSRLNAIRSILNLLRRLCCRCPFLIRKGREQSVTLDEKTVCIQTSLTFLYESSLDKMGITVKIKFYYFTGLQYDSKRVLPNHMLNVRLHVVQVKVLHSPLEDFDNGVQRIYTIFFSLHLSHHL